MKTILIAPEAGNDELPVMNSLPGDALPDAFHIKKPGFSEEDLRNYLSLLPDNILSLSVIHNHYTLASEFPLKGIHFPEAFRIVNRSNMKGLIARLNRQNPAFMTLSTSFHATINLHSRQPWFDYVLLGPVFDSISKQNYKSAFDLTVLKTALRQSPFNVIAVGGITREHLPAVFEAGFSGFAVKGAVWESKDPVSQWQSIKKSFSKTV